MDGSFGNADIQQNDREQPVGHNSLVLNSSEKICIAFKVLRKKPQGVINNMQL